jgi:tetratricopeptide (TPR) repeat protein
MVQLRFGVFCLSLILLTACDFSEPENIDYLQKGIDLYQQGELAAAEIELKNAIQKNPEVADAYYYLALVQEKSRNFKAMQLNLQEVVKLNPEHVEARVKLAKVYLLMGENDKALAQVEAVLKKQPDNADALTVKAQLLNRQRKYEEALSILDGVLATQPDFIDALSLKAVILIQQNQLDQALKIVNEGLTVDEKNIALWLLKVRIHMLQRDGKAIVNDYIALEKLEPDNVAIKFALAKAYVNQKQPDKAEAILRELVEKHPKNFKAKLVLLEFLSNTNKDSIKNQLDIFLKTATDNEKIDLAKWLLSKNNTEKAEAIFNQIVSNADKTENRINAHYQLALLKFRRQDLEGVEQEINAILDENPGFVDAKILKAAVLIARNDVGAAEKMLNDILWEKPDNDRAMVLLGKIYADRGERNKALQQFQQALKFNPANLRALLPVVQQEVAKQHLDYARELVQEAVLKAGPKLGLLQMLVDFDLTEKKWDSADKIIKLIGKNKKGELLAEFLQGKKLQVQGNCNKAIPVYQQILERYPWQTNALQALAQCYETLHSKEKLFRFLNTFLEKNPGHVLATLLQSRILASQGKSQQAVKKLQHLLEKSPSPSVYRELALLYQKAGDDQAAEQLFQRALDQYPQDGALLLAKASFLERQQKAREAITVYQKILELQPRNMVALNNYAALLLETGEQNNIEKAAKLASKFKYSEQPYFLDTYAWSLFKSGDVEGSRKILEKVVLMASDEPVFRYHLAQIYQQQGDKSKAVGELREALNLSAKQSFQEKEAAERLLNQLTQY